MFAKVFEQILDSSLAEDYQVRHVFEDLLKLADRDGIVDKTKESIARRTNVPLEIVTRAIAALEAPDPTSRTPDMEGRRIVRLETSRDWGWRIVNFARYRDSATKEMLKMTDAQRKAEWRKRRNLPPVPPLKTQTGDTDKGGDAVQSATVRDTSGIVRDTSGIVRDTSGTANTAPISPKLSASERITREKEIERVESAMAGIEKRNGETKWDREDRTEYKRLEARQKELMAQLGFQA